MSVGLENKSNTVAFFKKFQENSDMCQDSKKWLQIFVLSGNFGDIEFYYFSVDQSCYNGIKWIMVAYSLVCIIYIL